MAAALRQVLDARVMGGTYSRAELPRTFPITEMVWNNVQNIDGDSYDLVFDPEEQEPIASNVPGAPARTITPGPLRDKKATLFYAFNKIALSDICLDALREPASLALQNMGKTELNRQLMRFKMRHAIFKEIVLARILSVGTLYFDGLGRCLNSSSGATITVDMGVSSSHKTDLGGLITATWKTAGTDIAAHIETIKDQAEQDGVEEPTEIVLNRINLQYLRNNTKFQDWAKYNPSYTDTILKGGYIADLWGMNWHFVGGRWKDPSGTKQPFVPINKAIFMPKPGAWLKATAGSNFVPRGIGVFGDAMQALAQTDVVYGEFAYGKLIDDPWRLMAFMGEKFGLHFADQGAIWMADAFT